MTAFADGGVGEAGPGTGRLSARQWALLEAWLPGAVVLRDHSWGLVGTTVLEFAHEGERYIAKAGDTHDHHLARELRAHRAWLGPWRATGQAPTLVEAHSDARVLLTRYLPGELVEGTAYEWLAETYVQAGELLARLHGQGAVRDDEHEARENARTLAWFDEPHRISEEVVALVSDLVASWPTPPAALVPTHGDWQPRNWLVHEGEVRVIDLGRADLRPAATDLTRLAVQQFRADAGLAEAFVEGYGADLRDGGAWRRMLVREAVSTAVWAHRVGDEAFERQGHRMLAEALGLDPARVGLEGKEDRGAGQGDR